MKEVNLSIYVFTESLSNTLVIFQQFARKITDLPGRSHEEIAWIDEN
jgi:hypothetical protein